MNPDAMAGVLMAAAVLLLGMGLLLIREDGPIDRAMKAARRWWISNTRVPR